MPEFSGLAFISKVLMFLDPSNYVTLDKKIMQLKDENNFNNPITNIAFRVNDTSIRINDNSQFWYLKWCGLCKKIANEFFEDKIAADIERGFFRLVEKGQIEIAKNIIREITLSEPN